MPGTTIVPTDGHIKLGTIHQGRDGSRVGIAEINVDQLLTRKINILVTKETGTFVTVVLPEKSALALVKAILDFIPDISIATDERLLDRIKQAVDRTNEESQAVVDCLKRLPPVDS